MCGAENTFLRSVFSSHLYRVISTWFTGLVGPFHGHEMLTRRLTQELRVKGIEACDVMESKGILPVSKISSSTRGREESECYVAIDVFKALTQNGGEKMDLVEETRIQGKGRCTCTYRSSSGTLKRPPHTAASGRADRRTDGKAFELYRYWVAQ